MADAVSVGGGQLTITTYTITTYTTVPAAPLESTPERTQVGAPVASTAVSHAGDELLTKRELAARLKKSPRCIEQWMRRRYLPYIKIAHTVRFRWRDVLEALERLTIR